MILNEERIYYTRNQEYKYKRLDLSTLKLIYLLLKGPTIKKGKKPIYILRGINCNTSE